MGDCIMSIVINGTGTITGLSAGGLPSNSITAANIATGAVGADELLIGSGGAFEIGSNSYGNYTKFADGTMIQNGVASISHTSTLAYKMVTFPVAFYGSVVGGVLPYGFSGTQSTSHGDSNAGTEVYGRQEDNGGNVTTASSIYLACRTFLNASYGTQIAWQAIGRWKA